ncbi:hypothetical protein KK060_14335 [Fulvivirgaceae bacterium PWU20]|uniref:Uncharacterized protein n=1 Tax=Chryseosolibacter indicus TaxID=2782351 RepID=A0ABS5VSR2_9BACT|nr:hypothetical protein [Chryseosolibacter indicus]
MQLKDDAMLPLKISFHAAGGIKLFEVPAKEYRKKRGVKLARVLKLYYKLNWQFTVL